MMGLAESTHKLYACGVRRFSCICSAVGLATVPASEETLCHFAATLAGEGLRHRTIKSYMAGVRHLHISGTPSSPVSTGCTMSCMVSGELTVSSDGAYDASAHLSWGNI